MVQVTSDALAAWEALRATPGLGPKRLVRIARELSERGMSASALTGASATDLGMFGLPRRLADAALESLASPPPAHRVPASTKVLSPDDSEYPHERLTEDLPLPVVLWTRGNVSLLKAPGIAIAGSRSTPADVLALANELSTIVAKAGLNVVSGLAVGVDRASHDAALRFGTTTAVLAEGLLRLSRPDFGIASEESFLVVSGFEPDASWTPGRAMERNAHIAALADAVVIVSAGLSGGSWAQGQLCLRAKKPLFVLDLPPDVAEGNAKLIEQGARSLSPGQMDRVLEQRNSIGLAPAQLGLLDELSRPTD